MDVFDRAAALAAFGQEAILKAVVTTYLEEAEGARRRLEDHRDREALEDTAHWLKGGFSTLHAPRACDAAAALEKACQGPAPEEALDRLTRDLLTEMSRLHEHLQQQA